jgi:hypothetical protein
MLRIAAIGLTATLLFVAVCCPPPALALESQPKVMVCPITGEVCQTQEDDCDPPAPQVAVSADAPLKIITPDVGSLPAVPELAPPHESRPATITHWSAPTRTIVLRI